MSLRILFILCCLTTPLLAQIQEKLELYPEEIRPTSLTLRWSLLPEGQAGIYYGKTKALEMGALPAFTNTKQANNLLTTLQGLEAAHFYYVQPFVVVATDTIWGQQDYFSTQSNSTGVIEVYFNQGIDPSYSTGSSPDIITGGSNIENAIITKINNAQQTIDACIFNTTRTPIFNALQAAHNRGVQVRFIANAGTFTSNAALRNGQPLFPVFYANITDLMHNKFVVIDAQTVDSSWVWTGSCNWTHTDMYTNYNNIVVLQDQALAQAYTLEFNEMWGSTGAQFNASSAKVGADKLDNTPHVFNIGGRTVEAYFSPSDNTTDEIEASLYSANNDLEFCLLSFTRNELGTAIRNQHQNGILEHGMMENINDNGSEFSYLSSQGVNIVADIQPTALHHKYAIVDAGAPNSDPQVVTGSHNWTTAAETRNDENTLIIHDATIANLFLQEFALRWCQNNNNNNCALPFPLYTNTATLSTPSTGLHLFPNPAQHEVRLQLAQGKNKTTFVRVYSSAGQVVYQAQRNLEAGQMRLPISKLANGCYWVALQLEGQLYQEKLLIVR
jgi:phosphatidylserine/phosphatidylglycerophosphate/cardiolipin synthase-like enzyme